jgi:superfamily II DNA or RNA helicase
MSGKMKQLIIDDRLNEIINEFFAGILKNISPKKLAELEKDDKISSSEFKILKKIKHTYSRLDGKIEGVIKYDLKDELKIDIKEDEPAMEHVVVEETSDILDDCDIKQIEIGIKNKKDDIKILDARLRECKSRKYRYGKESITMNDLLHIIKRENIDNVRDFLNLFPTTGERMKGAKVTRNHVFEALWIISYVKNIANTENKTFYKSLEGGDTQTEDQVMGGLVNSGPAGGIADLYFEITSPSPSGSIDDKIEKVSCNLTEVAYPQCENKSIRENNKYLFSSKYYNKTKGVSDYDIEYIYTEALQRGVKSFNIILLVQHKEKLLEKMSAGSKKAATNLYNDILDVDDLDKHYKILLYLSKHKPDDKKNNFKPLVPRFHQKYFIDYTKQCIGNGSKNFVWGAVPRSGKSYMIGGLIAEVKPKVVLLYLGAITETKKQFIDELFNSRDKGYSNFDDYEIYDLQVKKDVPIDSPGKGKSGKIIIFSQEKNRMDVQKKELPKLIRDILNEKDKIIFFDEIHQGSGSGPDSLQERMLNTIVFDNPYKAFIMVTATFAKPYLKYINKGNNEGKLIQWRYDDIHLMKSIDKKVLDDYSGVETLITLEKMRQNILEENDGKIKLQVFEKLLKEEKEKGIDLEKLAKQYDKYPELIVSIPEIDETMGNDPDGFVINGNISVDKIFKPLMKKQIRNWNIASNFVKYIREYIYEKYIIQTLNQGSTLLKPHSEIWFMPTTFRNEKDDEEDAEGGGGFRNMTQNFTKVLMDNPWFRENYCIAILHSTGFDNSEIKFIEAKKEGGYNLKWTDVDVRKTGDSYCITTKCAQPSQRDKDEGVKECLLKQEACAKAHGKSLIILTGKMLRLGVSLPCVDIAIHMDPIKSVDTIYQSMFRVLTERDGKTAGIFIDMLTTRQISFMYEYTNYISPELTVEKKMKKLLEKLLLFNFNGINFQKGEDYQMLYDKLIGDFSLDDINMFKLNTRSIDLNEVDELVRSLDSGIIDSFHQIIEKLNINFKEVKKRGVKKNLKNREGTEMLKDNYKKVKPIGQKQPLKVQKNPELKQKYDEVSKFINDMVVLFSLFSSDDYGTNITKSDIIKEVNTFFESNISDIQKFCKEVDEEKLPESLKLSVIDCHLMNIIKNSVEKDKLNEEYKYLKSSLKELFTKTILKEDNFYKIFVDNIEQMKDLKNSSQKLKTIEPCSDEFIKDEKVLEIIRKRLTVREEEKNLYGEVFTPIELICEMFSHIDKKVWENPDLKWLDPANGIGNFPVVAYYKLMESLKDKYDPKKYPEKKLTLSQHIINRMLYMVELNPVNVRVCKKIFKMIDPDATPNIHTGSFIKGSRNEYDPKMKFHVIMGNPPYNKGGIRSKNKVTKEGTETIWPQFVKKALSLLEDNYYLLFINPGSWIGLKSTNSKMFMENQLLTLRFYNYGQALDLFGSVSGKIPLTYYLLQKSKGDQNTEIYDNCLGKFISFNIYKYKKIPIEAVKTMKKLLDLSDIHGSLNKYYSNTTRAKPENIKQNKSASHNFPLVGIDKGNIIVSYYDKNQNKNNTNKKLVFPNFSMGYPLMDNKGNLYPKSNMMHILDYENNEHKLKQIQSLFYTSLVLYMINTFKTKQNFFHNQIFSVLPDITKMTKKEDINDEDLIKLFNLDKDDIDCIEKYKQKGEGRLSSSQIKYFKEWRIGSKSSKPSKDIYGDDPKYEGQVGAPEGFEPEPELEPPEAEGDKPKRTSSKGKSKRSKKKTGKKKKMKMRRTFRKKKNNRTIRKIRL